MTNRTQEVALTIRSQIKEGLTAHRQRGLWAMMCWGFQTPMCGQVEEQDALIFKVNGLKFKGKVAVALNGWDTYTVYAYTPKDSDWVMVLEDVYCDALTRTLDKFIEG